MEQFAETIQNAMREMGAQFLKAVADLHKVERGNETGSEDE